jgi:hypothetical protein
MYEKFRTVAEYIAWRTKTYEKLRAVIPEQETAR